MLASSLVRGDDIPHKCGTSAVADFVAARSTMDKDLLLALGEAALVDRPILDLSCLSPTGRFKVHYTKTGADAVYKSSTDVNQNGVPDYVDKVADIADSVYTFIIDSLGYPPPPSDSFYSPTGEGQYDIYLLSLGYYGLAYTDSASIDTSRAGLISATSFIELDNDYHNVNRGEYKDRPLDAVRVTLAHEYFHAVQFGMNYTDAEPSSRRYWMEMSAVWMEEEQYTNINDYYNYLTYFFNFPARSLQDFDRGDRGIHSYASVVFPLYLSTVYDRDIIKAIWEKSHSLGLERGPGPRFLTAVQHVIDSASNHTENLSSTYRDFALWNYFTGERADAAPTGVGYAERSFYPSIPDSAMISSDRYPLLVFNMTKFWPELNAATYLRFYGIQAIERRFFACGQIEPDSLCTVRFVDTICADRTIIPDSVVTRSAQCTDYHPPTECHLRSGCADTTLLYYGPSFLVGIQVDTVRPGWGLTVLNHPVTDPTRPIVDSKALLPADTVSTYGVDLKRPGETDAITLILSTGSSDLTLYRPRVGRYVAWYVNDTTQPLPKNAPVMLLDPYPNPAVENESVWFRFQVPTNDTAAQLCARQQTWMEVDLYTVAGDRVFTIQKWATLQNLGSKMNEYRVSWDMTNSYGQAVSSGVYLAVARLRCGGDGGTLLGVGKTKVAVIR